MNFYFNRQVLDATAMALPTLTEHLCAQFNVLSVQAILRANASCFSYLIEHLFCLQSRTSNPFAKLFFSLF